MTKIMNICMISDNNYTIYLGTLITSILKNSAADDNFCFHVITEDMTDDNKNKLLQLKEIKNFDIKFYVPQIDMYKSWEEKYKELIVWRYNVFIKLDIPEILKDLDRVLFLDCDMVVFKSLREVFETDISDYLIAVAGKYNTDIVRNNQKKIVLYNDKKKNDNDIKDGFSGDSDLHKFGIEDKTSDEWFNSGFMYMNLKRLRGFITEKDKEEHLMRCINSKVKFGDEAFFNYFIKNDEIKRLDGKYNVGVTYYEDFYDDNICIGHYTGAFRPLSFPSYLPVLDKNTYFYKMWEYFVLTPWFKENPMYYINIFNQHDITLLDRKINKLIDFIVWAIPSRKLRDKIRAKIKDELELL